MLDIFVCLCLELLILHVYVHYLSIFWQSRTGLNVMLKLPKKHLSVFLHVPVGPKTVLMPLQSNFKYICIMFVHTWKIIMPFIHVVLEECTP